MRLASRRFLAVSPMFRPRYATRSPTRPVRVASAAEYCESVTEHQAGSTRVTKAGTPDRPGYPGELLGLPEVGRGAVAGMARRIGAIFIDWLVCTFVAVTATRLPFSQAGYWTLIIFAAQDCIFTGLTGTTLGKLALRIRVARLDGGPVGGWALVRTLLLLAVVPPLIVDRDLRGLHDRAANTVVVRL